MRLSTASVPTGSRSAARHPISRWYVGPAAERAARWLAPSRIRPLHLTVAGLLAAGGAVAVLSLWPAAGPWAALLVAVAWFCDRADGLLARYQLTASAWGAWLDANVDELVDVGLHVAVAGAAARLSGSSLPWFLVLAFVAGKYLFFRGLELEEEIVRGAEGGDDRFAEAEDACHCLPRKTSPSVAAPHCLRPSSQITPSDKQCGGADRVFVERAASSGTQRRGGWLRRCYHLPGNADIRVHLLVAALLTGWLTAELAVVAVYYNVRWMARYVLVARRLGGLR